MNAARLEKVDGQFLARYGRRPSVRVSAPGRINLIGEHTDYNDGLVLPMAIDRETLIVADRVEVAPKNSSDRSGDEQQRFFSMQLQQERVWSSEDINAVPATPDWTSYVRGVIAGFADLGWPLSGVDALIDSNIPVGAGLSSSAALEVAVGMFIQGMLKVSVEPLELAKICQRAEHEYAGVKCGLMDQLSSVFGKRDHLLLIDCRSLAIDYIPFLTDDVSVLVINSMVKHQLGDSEYSLRRSQCNEAANRLGKNSLRDVTMKELVEGRAVLAEVAFRRAHHVLTENERVEAVAQAIRLQEWGRAGELMYQSHQSLKSEFEVSCHELDLLVTLASQIGIEGGVWGSRMTGGGFGGCTISLIDSNRKEEIAERMVSDYARQTGIRADWFTARPADGTRILPEDSEKAE